jgi:flagellar export protein FliJ
MKQFVFKLEKALKLRAWQEKEARSALGVAVGELAAVERALADNARHRHDAQARRTDAERLAMLHNYLLRLDNEKDALLQKREEAQQRVEQRRTEWAQAASAMKSLENLRARRAADYRREAQKAEEQAVESSYNGRCAALRVSACG